jgi:hypothetical protein
MSTRKTIQIKARITEVQYADLQRQAKSSGMTLSELIRRRTFNKPVISSTDNSTAKSIDRLGRMLKHYYPKDKGWASADDRRKWWRLVEELQEIARSIRNGSRR